MLQNCWFFLENKYIFFFYVLGKDKEELSTLETRPENHRPPKKICIELPGSHKH